MNQQEIAILIKARNEAKSTFDELNKQLGGVKDQGGGASRGMQDVGEKTRGAGEKAAGASIAFGILGERVMRALYSSFQDTIQAANSLDAGLVGVSSVARAMGQDVDAAKAAAQSLARDGLMTVSEAATGLKNLMAKGMDIPQAVEVMNRLKDSAAFGRQGMLDFGQAVVGATEGIKNGISATSDNAGVTTNLSIIYERAGVAADALSGKFKDQAEAQKFVAQFAKETNAQMGDAGRFLETAAGKQAQFNSQVTIAQQKIGKELQPALASMLHTLEPMVKVIGDNAAVVAPLAIGLAAVVAPVVAIRTAAALGIPSLTTMAGSLVGAGQAAAAMAVDIKAGVALTGSWRAGLALATETTAGATLATRVFGAAVNVALGPIGLIIAALGLATAAYVHYKSAAAEAQLQQQTAGAKQDTINRAIQFGAAATITYTEAIEFNNRIQNIRVALSDKSAAAQLKAVDAELALGRITQGQADAQRQRIEGEQRLVDIQRSRANFTEVVAAKEKAFRDEVAATGFTLQELVANLKKNEEGFTAWAKQSNLSDEAIRRVKDALKDTTKAHSDHEAAMKKSEAAAKALEDQQQKLRDELEKFGILTQDQVNHNLIELREKMVSAKDAGVPLDAIARGLGKSFIDLANAADKAGLKSGEVRTEFENLAMGAGLLLSTTQTYSGLLVTLPGQTDANTRAIQAAREEGERLYKNQEDVNAAFAEFGLKTPEALRTAARAAVDNFNTMRASGQASTADLKVAYQQMIDAQKAATGQLPSVWQTQVLPAIQGTVEQIRTAIDGSFAQMLLGAKGFQEGFLDIWQTLKKGVENILAQLLQSFLDGFLKSMIAGMSGQQGGFSSAFSGLFSGGGSKGGSSGGGMGGILGMFGGGGSKVPDLEAGISGALPIGGQGGSGGWLSKLGGLFGFGGGGGSGAAGGAGGGGMGLGAALGIGAIALPFAIKGIQALIGIGGPSKEEKAGRTTSAEFEASMAQYGAAGTSGLGASLSGLQQQYIGAGFGSSEAATKAQADFAKLFAAQKQGAEAVNAVIKEINANIQSQQALISGTDPLMQKYGLTWKDLGKEAQQAHVSKELKDAQAETKKLIADGFDQCFVYDKMNKVYGQYVRDVIDSGGPIERSMLPALQRLKDMGTLVDATGQAISDVDWDRLVREAEAAAAGVNDAMDSIHGPNIETGTRPTGDDYANGEGPGNRNTEGMGEAAAGIYASGARGVATWFGEGGQPEVGGPADFFEKIFAKLGVVGGRRGGGGDLHLTINTPGILASSGEFTNWVHTRLVPAIHQAYRDNVDGAQTYGREALAID